MSWEPLPDGVDPNQRFYDLQGRRNSGMSNQRFIPDGDDQNSGRPGGRSYQQGIEIIDIHQSRGCLPILGRGDRYRYVIEFRDENRNIVNIYDSRENNYFTDTAMLMRNRYTWKEETDYFIPSGALVTDAGLIANITDNGIVNPDNNFQVKYNDVLYTKSSQVDIYFPDGGIRQVPEYYLDTKTYGEGKEHRADTPYTDLARYSGLSWVQHNGPSGMYPEVSKSTSYDESRIYNGIIEPFLIRAPLYGKNTFATGEPYPGKVRGDSLDSNLIVFQYPPPQVGRFTGGQYEDVVARGFRPKLGTVDDGDVTQECYALLEGDYVSADIFHVDHYIDRLVSTDLFMDEEMLNFMLSLDSTFDEGNLAFANIDATVGFDAPSKERFGTNVYRDLLR